MENQDIKNEDKLLGALAYPIPFLPLFLIFTDKKNIPFCRYHGWQALFWQIAEVIISVAIGIIATALSFMGLGCLISMVSPLLGIAMLVISILFAVRTFGGEFLVIPYITEFSKKYSDNPQ